MRNLLIAAIAILSTPASAEFFDGNELHQFCQMRGTELATDALLGGYVAGVAGYAEAAGGRICAPRNSNVMQATDVFCGYLDSNPASRHLPAASLAEAALSEAWPCP